MLYFDTSFLTPLILEEPTSARIERFVVRLPAGELAVSHWTRVEFSSLLAREVRMGGLDDRAAEAANHHIGGAWKLKLESSQLRNELST